MSDRTKLAGTVRAKLATGAALFEGEGAGRCGPVGLRSLQPNGDQTVPGISVTDQQVRLYMTGRALPRCIGQDPDQRRRPQVCHIKSPPRRAEKHARKKAPLHAKESR